MERDDASTADTDMRTQVLCPRNCLIFCIRSPERTLVIGFRQWGDPGIIIDPSGQTR